MEDNILVLLVNPINYNIILKLTNAAIKICLYNVLNYIQKQKKIYLISLCIIILK